MPAGLADAEPIAPTTTLPPAVGRMPGAEPSLADPAEAGAGALPNGRRGTPAAAPGDLGVPGDLGGGLLGGGLFGGLEAPARGMATFPWDELPTAGPRLGGGAGSRAARPSALTSAFVGEPGPARLGRGASTFVPGLVAEELKRGAEVGAAEVTTPARAGGAPAFDGGLPRDAASASRLPGGEPPPLMAAAGFVPAIVFRNLAAGAAAMLAGDVPRSRRGPEGGGVTFALATGTLEPVAAIEGKDAGQASQRVLRKPGFWPGQPAQTRCADIDGARTKITNFSCMARNRRRFPWARARATLTPPRGRTPTRKDRRIFALAARQGRCRAAPASLIDIGRYKVRVHTLIHAMVHALITRLIRARLGTRCLRAHTNATRRSSGRAVQQAARRGARGTCYGAPRSAAGQRAGRAAAVAAGCARTRSARAA